MAHILVRDLDSETIERLKARAKGHRRSLQGEVKRILEDAATLSVVETRSLVEQVRARFAGKAFMDSAELIREDRDR